MYCSFLILFLFVVGIQCKSIVDQNDTALEYLNNCKCVLDIHCHNGVMNIRGIGIITIRNNVDGKLADSTAGSTIKCSKPSYICCRKNTENEIGNRIDSTEISENPKHDNNNSTTNLTTTTKNRKSNGSCGKQKPTINIRISNPEKLNEAIDGEFPWMVSIFRKNLENQFTFRCAGSLISDCVVLTAAHCLYSVRKRPSELKILANSKAELGSIGSDETEERNVEKIIIHPDFYAGASHNDIALIFLSESYSETRKLNNLCLPDSNISYDLTRCLAAGWGADQSTISTAEKFLKKVELPIIDHQVCENLLKKTRLGENFELHDSFICAGGQKGKDTCKGDGGGPLMCPNDEERYIQVGIVSWGIDCAKENHPGVYTDVTKFSEWIRNNTKK